jgi:uncharacterized membrane protein YgcG
MTGNHQVQAHLGALWTLLQDMKIEGRGAERRFEEALAAEEGWSLDFAGRVTREYRRFLYLAASSAGEITPSRTVDGAWHLHLTYSRHYWDELCGRILGRPLHHNPSTGDASDDERFARQYEDTLALYRRTFGETPPADIWPSSAAVPGEGIVEAEAPDHAVRNLGLALLSVPILLLLGGLAMGGLGAVAGGAAGAAIVGVFLLHPAPASEMPDKRSQGDSSGCGGFAYAGDGGGDSCGGDGGGASCGGGGCGG